MTDSLGSREPDSRGCCGKGLPPWQGPARADRILLELERRPACHGSTPCEGRTYQCIESQYFRERLERAGARCVLELGCGGGILTSSLEDGPWTLFAQDLLPGPLVIARSHLRRACLVRCDAVRLPFRAQSFDAVLSSDFLEHAADLRAVVAESARVLRPGELFLYETVNRTLLSLIVGKVLLEWVLRYVPVGTHRFRDFILPEELHALMDEYGIRNLEIFGIIPERGVLRSLIARSAHPFRLDPRRLVGSTWGAAGWRRLFPRPGAFPPEIAARPRAALAAESRAVKD